MKIVIGSDHRGYAQKEFLKRQAQCAGYSIEWIDVGAYDAARSDYPQYAQMAVGKIIDREADCGVLLCATGIGMAVAANRFPYVYAAVVWDEQIARSAKEDDNANVLVIPSDFVNEEQCKHMLQAWLQSTFKGGRYQQRLQQIDE